jgi:hypothetical protein
MIAARIIAISPPIADSRRPPASACECKFFGRQTFAPQLNLGVLSWRIHPRQRISLENTPRPNTVNR